MGRGNTQSSSLGSPTQELPFLIRISDACEEYALLARLDRRPSAPCAAHVAALLGTVDRGSGEPQSQRYCSSSWPRSL